jgi:hypothetical protein
MHCIWQQAACDWSLQILEVSRCEKFASICSLFPLPDENYRLYKGCTLCFQRERCVPPVAAVWDAVEKGILYYDVE